MNSLGGGEKGFRWARAGWASFFALVALAAFIGLSPSAQDQLRCRFFAQRNVPHASVPIRVPRSRQSDLAAYIERFSHDHDLIFGAESWSADSTIRHRRTHFELCNRLLDINIGNTQDEEVFIINSSRNEGYDSERFIQVYRAFIGGLIMSFRREPVDSGLR